ncbi:MAG: thioredoxin fold domain-containing protein [Alphaproteobacteria bacterium]|nr:thioredoxin fold domain-containing protein [Alphaproteobacteria bacterium]
MRIFKSGAALLWMASLVAILVAGDARAEFIVESIDNNFPDEIAVAAEENKMLVVMFEQTGCPYCAKMHARVFPDPKVNEYYSKRFVMFQSNIRGNLSVVGPSGEKMTEKKLARKLRVRATPVFIFYDKTGQQALRVTGFMDAERFIKAGKYVADGVYKTKTSLYRYMLQN